MTPVELPEPYKTEVLKVLHLIRDLEDRGIHSMELWVLRKNLNECIRRAFHEHILPNWHTYSVEEQQTLQEMMARSIEMDEVIEQSLAFRQDDNPI